MLTRLVLLLALVFHPLAVGVLTACPLTVAGPAVCSLPAEAASGCCCCAPAAPEEVGCCGTVSESVDLPAPVGTCPCARPAPSPTTTQAVDRAQQKSETLTPAAYAPARPWDRCDAMRPMHAASGAPMRVGPSLPALCRWLT